MTVRVGEYARISDDIEGLALGVGRQRSDNRKLADLRQWEIVDSFVDNDVSAFKGRARPEFERLLTALGSGALDGVIVYDLDRFARRPDDLERAIAIFDKRKLRFATVQGDIDLSTPDGRTMARVMVAFANKSSMDTSRRVARKHLEQAEKGAPTHGRRAFGWKADRVHLEPTEARLIRKAARDILSGTPLVRVTARWNEAGVQTAQSAPRWTATVVNQVLTSPRVAGFRVYQGGTIQDGSGAPVRGPQTPILDPDTWQALCAHFERGKRPGRTGARRRLLSGLLRCGGCGHPMYGKHQGHEGAKWAYACPPSTGSAYSCGRCCIIGAETDSLVSEAVATHLGGIEAGPDEIPAWTGAAELELVQHKIAKLMDAYTSGSMEHDTVFPAIGKLENRLRELRGQQGDYLRDRPPRRPVGAKDWPSLDIHEQRALIDSVAEAIVVTPSGGRGTAQGYRPDRVKLVWRR